MSLPCAKPLHTHQHMPHHSAYPPVIIKGTMKCMLLTCWSYSIFLSTCRLHANYCAKLTKSGHNPSVVKECFIVAEQFIQHKLRAPKLHKKSLNSNKNEDKESLKRYNEELALFTIPLASELLYFAA